MIRLIKHFFYSFIPKVIKARDKVGYSATRLMLLGYSTTANVISCFSAIVFYLKNEFEMLLYLNILWVVSALYLGTILAFRAKDRLKLANHAIDATKNILTKNK